MHGAITGGPDGRPVRVVAWRWWVVWRWIAWWLRTESRTRIVFQGRRVWVEPVGGSVPRYLSESWIVWRRHDEN